MFEAPTILNPAIIALLIMTYRRYMFLFQIELSLSIFLNAFSFIFYFIFASMYQFDVGPLYSSGFDYTFALQFLFAMARLVL